MMIHIFLLYVVSIISINLYVVFSYFYVFYICQLCFFLWVYISSLSFSFSVLVILAKGSSILLVFKIYIFNYLNQLYCIFVLYLY